MPDKAHVLLFLSAALLLAITPGPGIFYVLARTLKGGRQEGGLLLPQFLLLGMISVFLNTSADMVVVLLAGPIGQRMQASLRLRRGQRLFSGCFLIGLGGYVAVSGGKR